MEFISYRKRDHFENIYIHNYTGRHIDLYIKEIPNDKIMYELDYLEAVL